MAGAISMIAYMLQFSAIFGSSDDREGSNPLGLMSAIVIAPISDRTHSNEYLSSS